MADPSIEELNWALQQAFEAGDDDIAAELASTIEKMKPSRLDTAAMADAWAGQDPKRQAALERTRQNANRGLEINGPVSASFGLGEMAGPVEQDWLNAGRGVGYLAQGVKQSGLGILRSGIELAAPVLNPAMNTAPARQAIGATSKALGEFARQDQAEFLANAENPQAASAVSFVGEQMLPVAGTAKIAAPAGAALKARVAAGTGQGAGYAAFLPAYGEEEGRAGEQAISTALGALLPVGGEALRRTFGDAVQGAKSAVVKALEERGIDPTAFQRYPGILSDAMEAAAQRLPFGLNKMLSGASKQADQIASRNAVEIESVTQRNAAALRAHEAAKERINDAYRQAVDDYTATKASRTAAAAKRDQQLRAWESRKAQLTAEHERRIVETRAAHEAAEKKHLAEVEARAAAHVEKQAKEAASFAARRASISGKEQRAIAGMLHSPRIGETAEEAAKRSPITPIISNPQLEGLRNQIGENIGSIFAGKKVDITPEMGDAFKAVMDDPLLSQGVYFANQRVQNKAMTDFMNAAENATGLDGTAASELRSIISRAASRADGPEKKALLALRNQFDSALDTVLSDAERTALKKYREQYRLASIIRGSNGGVGVEKTGQVDINSVANAIEGSVNRTGPVASRPREFFSSRRIAARNAPDAPKPTAPPTEAKYPRYVAPAAPTIPPKPERLPPNTATKPIRPPMPAAPEALPTPQIPKELRGIVNLAERQNQVGAQTLTAPRALGLGGAGALASYSAPGTILAGGGALATALAHQGLRTGIPQRIINSEGGRQAAVIGAQAAAGNGRNERQVERVSQVVKTKYGDAALSVLKDAGNNPQRAAEILSRLPPKTSKEVIKTYASYFGIPLSNRLLEEVAKRQRNGATKRTANGEP